MFQLSIKGRVRLLEDEIKELKETLWKQGVWASQPFHTGMVDLSKSIRLILNHLNLEIVEIPAKTELVKKEDK